MRTCVVLPTINEADNIVIIIPALRFYLRGLDHGVVVVDDGSTDGTPTLAAELGAYVIERGRRLGLGSAIHAGLTYCVGGGFDAGVVMDADLQHPPRVVPTLVSECSRADICIGVRVGRDSLPFYRRVVSSAAEWLAKLAYGDGITDLMSGFFAVNLNTMGKYIAGFTPTPRNYKYLLEFLMYLRRIGASPRISQVPYRQLARVNGASKMGLGEVITYFMTVMRK